MPDGECALVHMLFERSWYALTLASSCAVNRMNMVLYIPGGKPGGSPGGAPGGGPGGMGPWAAAGAGGFCGGSLPTLSSLSSFSSSLSSSR